MDEAMRAYWAAGEAMAAADLAARRAQVTRLESVLDFLDAYPAPEPLPTPAGEKTVAAGAEGAGDTGQWVSLDVSTLLGMSEATAWHLVRDAANLRSRHPKLWAAFTQLKVEDWQAARIARMAADLDAEAARWVDEKLAGIWGTAPWNRILRRTEGLIARADQDLAARKTAKAQANRFLSIRHLGDSTSLITGRIDTGAALHLQDVIGRLADDMVTAGATEPVPLLRARALEDLATPRLPADHTPGSPAPTPPAPQLPLADLIIHIAAEDLDPQTTGTGVARVTARGGDVGPVLVHQIAHLLGHRRVRVYPVIDLAGDPSTDSYEIPDRIRRQLLIREEYSVFPYSTRRSRSADLDHTIPYRRATPGSPAPPAQTRVSNLGPLGRGEHRAKTAGAWHLDQPAPGLYLWTNRLGRRWAVIDGHTHRLPDGPPPDNQPGLDRARLGAVTPITAPAAGPRPDTHPVIDLIFH